MGSPGRYHFVYDRMDIEKIPDTAVFNIESNWYKQAVALFSECASKNYTSGHRHHWLPCAIIAEFLFKKCRPDNYRDIVDEKYPQKLVRMPVNAHILIHYYIWRAVKRKFRRKMEYAFGKLCGMKDPNGEYFAELDTCIKTGKAPKIHDWKKPQKQAAGDAPHPQENTASPLQSIPENITHSAALKLCSEAWKRYTGPHKWPKFQHDFMKQFHPIWKIQRKKRRKEKRQEKQKRRRLDRKRARLRNAAKTDV